MRNSTFKNVDIEYKSIFHNIVNSRECSQCRVEVADFKLHGSLEFGSVRQSAKIGI